MKTLLAVFDGCMERIAAAIHALPAEKLIAESDIKVPFATNRAEALLFGAIHIAVHAGQLSTIRRSLGKPPIV